MLNFSRNRENSEWNDKMTVFQYVRKKLNTGKPIDVDRIYSKIEKYDVISFDIFDTLLKRNISKPTDVFSYMAKKLGKYDFLTRRIEAENKARKKNKNSEITLKDIYKEYGEDYSNEELEAEAELLIVNDDMFLVFKKCIESKRVVLISDMYLPEVFISEILTRKGIIGYEKVYISSSLNLTKSSGELFKYVSKDLGVDKSKIIHIGDSIYSDYKVPKKMGINAIHIPTHIKKAKYQINGSSIEENIVNSFINNTIPQNADEYYRFGYEKLGMFLWGYSKWLHDSVESAEIENIYFFSRDGLIMKRAFDSIYTDVNTYYLEVSRRALRVPMLWMNHEFEHVLDMISPSKLVSLATIFDGVGLNIENYKNLIKKYGFKLATCFDRNELLRNKKLREMYHQLESDIEKVSRKEYELLVKYIKQNNLKGKFAIVDIGWSGGMQRYLCEILDMLCIDYQIKGYYIGVADYYKRNQSVVPSLDLNGYLFDFSHDKKAIDKRSPFVGLFETLFLEQDGSVKNYIETNGVIKGNRLDYEYVQNGEPTHELKCVQRIQVGALDFVKRFGNKNIHLPATILFKGIEETGLRPTKKDLKLFADFRFFDEGETHCLANPKSLFIYALHIKEFKKDFLLSRWKIGFMKRMMKLNLPYENMYRYMLRFK